MIIIQYYSTVSLKMTDYLHMEHQIAYQINYYIIPVGMVQGQDIQGQTHSYMIITFGHRQ